MHGKVKWFSPKLGYGYILSEDNREVFVHHDAIDMKGYKLLHTNEEVIFDEMQNMKGMYANNVRRINPVDFSLAKNPNRSSYARHKRRFEFLKGR